MEYACPGYLYVRYRRILVKKIIYWITDTCWISRPKIGYLLHKSFLRTKATSAGGRRSRFCFLLLASDAGEPSPCNVDNGRKHEQHQKESWWQARKLHKNLNMPCTSTWTDVAAVSWVPSSSTGCQKQARRSPRGTRGHSLALSKCTPGTRQSWTLQPCTHHTASRTQPAPRAARPLPVGRRRHFGRLRHLRFHLELSSSKCDYRRAARLQRSRHWLFKASYSWAIFVSQPSGMHLWPLYLRTANAAKRPLAPFRYTSMNRNTFRWNL